MDVFSPRFSPVAFMTAGDEGVEQKPRLCGLIVSGTERCGHSLPLGVSILIQGLELWVPRPGKPEGA